MEDGLLSLKWNNHKTTFFEILKTLRDKANYTDATLAVEGKFYPVHKLVLSTCSEYFTEIFERTPCKSPVVVLKDVRSQDLESLLDYMYLGEVNVNQNDLALLLKTAECLRIKGLAVPDDDTTRHSNTSTPHHKTHSLSTDEIVRETPPAKRRKEDSSASSNLSPPRISPSIMVPSSPPHPLTNQLNKSTSDLSSPRELILDTPLVKVEMEEGEEGEEAFQSDTNYDSNTEVEGRDFTVEKSEHDSAVYPNTGFTIESTQQAGEMSWEDGENSFPPEAFGGDSSGQQAGGARAGVEPMGFVQVALSPGGGTNNENDHQFDPSNPFDHHHLLDQYDDDHYDEQEEEEEEKKYKLQRHEPGEKELHSNDDEEDPFGLGKDSDLLSVSIPPNLQSQPAGDYPCLFCGKLFFYPSSLEKHVRTHTGEKPFKCSRCSYCASQKSHLKTHMLRKHNIAFRSDDDEAPKPKKSK